MALRTILTMDKPILRAKAKKVSRFDAYLARLVDDMWETMREAPGVGLAAPQIGEPVRVLVAEYEDEQVALVNPEIVKRSEEEVLGTEGCLSIPGFVGDDVPRAQAITVKARDPHGKEIRVKAEGWFARILQHEIDHLDGVLYIDRIPKDNVRPVEPDEVVDEAETHHFADHVANADDRQHAASAPDAATASASTDTPRRAKGTRARAGANGASGSAHSQAATPDATASATAAGIPTTGGRV